MFCFTRQIYAVSSGTVRRGIAVTKLCVAVLEARHPHGISRFGGSIIGAPSGHDSQFSVNRKDSSIGFVQAGLSKNWSGTGITSVYGEYWTTNNVGADITGAT